jgi:hypothetical protein
MLSEVLRAGRASTAGLSPLSTPDSILMCYDKYSLMQSFYEQVYEITIFLSQIALHKNARYTEDASS